MKIAMYYTKPFETGGVEKTMLNRGKILSKLGHDVTYIFNDNCSIEMLEKWAKYGNVVRYGYEDYYDTVIYDAIHKIPYINAETKIQVFNGNLIEGNEKYITNIEMDDFVAVSEECARQVKELYNIDCKIIPNIIDEEEIRTLMKEKYDIPKAKYNFVVVARFDENKGYHKLQKIIKEIHERLKDYQVIFVGSNDNYPRYMEKMKAIYKDYNVLFVGKQDNPYKYMYNADYIFISSDYESQCMVLDEALICGTPVISTDFPVAKAKIDGKNGLLVNKAFDNYDLDAILKLKKGFEYKYPDYSKKWAECLKKPVKKDYKFSIIIPNYNNGKYLDKCLTSVLNQTYKNYEIIFVDDMSTDNSLEIANKLLKEHKVIQLKQKRLNGGSRNVGILEATGDYIMCIDSDDWLKHDKVLEKLNSKIRNQDVIFTGFDLFDGNKEGLYAYVPKNKNLYDSFTENVCAIWTKVVKTSILKSTLFPEGTLAEDRVHHYRVIEKCKSFLNIQESTHVWNRANTTSVTTDRGIEWEASIFKHMGEMYKFIKTTKNEQYKNYVKKKYDAQMNELQKGIYRQL